MEPANSRVSPDEYRSEREARGLTQAGLAAALGVTRVTIARRETGARPITREAELALRTLPKTKRRDAPRNGGDEPRPQRT
jgi:transcriptional regulator with XRE-family HTH domain